MICLFYDARLLLAPCQTSVTTGRLLSNSPVLLMSVTTGPSHGFAKPALSYTFARITFLICLILASSRL